MPLTVLLWILVLLPAAMLAWFLFAMMIEMNVGPEGRESRPGRDSWGVGLLIMALLLTIAAPNLLWYKAVRDVMMPEAAPMSLSVEKSAKSTKNEPVEAIGVDTATLPAAVPPLMVQ